MKKALSVVLLLLLSACSGATPATEPELISFLARESGISGSYNSTTYLTKDVRPRVGPLACVSGRLASYSEVNKENGVVQFDAVCEGENKYEGTAGFTLNEVQKYGHITAVVDGNLVRIQL